ncbi:MAG: hypothetical protein ABIL68_16650, partial [bacterium]
IRYFQTQLVDVFKEQIRLVFPYMFALKKHKRGTLPLKKSNTILVRFRNILHNLLGYLKLSHFSITTS